MAKVFKINFGSATESVNGKSADMLRNAQIDLINRNRAASSMEPLSAGEIEELRAEAFSQRENEKTILRVLCETYASTVDKSLATIIEFSDVMQEIKDSEDHITFTKDVLDKLKKSIGSLKEIPAQWLAYRSLFKQLDKPEEVEIGK